MNVQYSNNGHHQLMVGNFKIVLDTETPFASSPSDFLVNPAKPSLLGGGGLDKVVHAAAGRALKDDCKKIPKERGKDRCPTGEARITKGEKLPQAYVIHTVGPKVKKSVTSKEKQQLWDAYHNSLTLADQCCSYVKDHKAKHAKFFEKIHSSK